MVHLQGYLLKSAPNPMWLGWDIMILLLLLLLLFIIIIRKRRITEFTVSLREVYGSFTVARIQIELIKICFMCCCEQLSKLPLLAILVSFSLSACLFEYLYSIFSGGSLWVRLCHIDPCKKWSTLEDVFLSCVGACKLCVANCQKADFIFQQLIYFMWAFPGIWLIFPESVER